MNIGDKCCAVYGCTNKSRGGVFVGDFCLPCSETIKAPFDVKGRRSKLFNNIRSVVLEEIANYIREEY